MSPSAAADGLIRQLTFDPVGTDVLLRDTGFHVFAVFAYSSSFLANHCSSSFVVVLLIVQRQVRGLLELCDEPVGDVQPRVRHPQETGGGRIVVVRRAAADKESSAGGLGVHVINLGTTPHGGHVEWAVPARRAVCGHTRALM
jgi:hypothetical protein